MLKFFIDFNPIFLYFRTVIELFVLSLTKVREGKSLKLEYIL